MSIDCQVKLHDTDRGLRPQPGNEPTTCRILHWLGSEPLSMGMRPLCKVALKGPTANTRSHFMPRRLKGQALLARTARFGPQFLGYMCLSSPPLRCIVNTPSTSNATRPWSSTQHILSEEWRPLPVPGRMAPHRRLPNPHFNTEDGRCGYRHSTSRSLSSHGSSLAS